MSMKWLVFCETAWQIEQADRIRESGDQGVNIVALTARAAWECQRRSLPYLKLEDYASEIDLSAQERELFETSLRWVSWIDGFLQRHVPEFKQAQFQPASAWQFVLQTWLSEFFIAEYVLRNLIARAQCLRISYWPWQPTQPDWHLQQETSIYPIILPILAPQHNVLLHELEHQQEVCKSTMIADVTLTDSRSLRFTLEYLYSHLFTPLIMAAQSRFGGHWLWEECRQLYKAGPSKYFRSLPSQIGAKKAVLFFGRGYDLDGVFGSLRGRGVRIDLLDVYVPGSAYASRYPNANYDPAISSTLAKLWDAVIQHEEFWEPFSSWKIGRNCFAETTLGFWWKEMIPELWAGYCRAQSAISQRPYGAVLGWEAGGETLSGAMLQAAGAAGIPRLVYQHGGSSRLRSLFWHVHFKHADQLLVYGVGTAQLLTHGRAASETSRATIAIGSAKLDRLRANARQKDAAALRMALGCQKSQPVVLYIPTMLGGYGRVFGELAGYPNVSYFELQQRVLRLFKQYPNIKLLYKDFTLATSGYNPIPDFIRRELPDVTVVHDLPLTRLMWAVDAIVIDHAVTALGEVLLTNKRVVVYDPDPIEGLELPDARDLLQRRAAVATTPDEFEAAVKALLESGDFSELAQPDDSFLRAYCTHLNDGRSAERAADEIMRVMRQR